MTHPILSELPYETQARSFEQEVDHLSQHLSTESKKAEITGLMRLHLDLKDLGDSVLLRITERSKRR